MVHVIPCTSVYARGMEVARKGYDNIYQGHSDVAL